MARSSSFRFFRSWCRRCADPRASYGTRIRRSRLPAKTWGRVLIAHRHTK